MNVHFSFSLTDIHDSGFKFSELEMSEQSHEVYFSRRKTHPYPSELVLSILLESFIFSPSSKEIVWNMRGLASPTIKGSKQDRPVMPMKLTLVA